MIEPLSEYQEAVIRAKKRIEYRYAVDAGLSPVGKMAHEDESAFRTRIRETLEEADYSLRHKMSEDKRQEYAMLRVEYDRQ